MLCCIFALISVQFGNMVVENSALVHHFRLSGGAVKGSPVNGGDWGVNGYMTRIRVSSHMRIKRAGSPAGILCIMLGSDKKPNSWPVYAKHLLAQ